mgnify:CR=1 FL=1
MNAYARAEARALLKRGPPFAGYSSFKNKPRLKEIGGDHVKWNPELKQWCAHTETVMFELMDEDIWYPVGVDCNQLSFEAAAMLQEQRRVMDREESAANAERREAEAALAAARTTALEQRDLQIEADEPDLIAEAEAHGVTVQMIEATTRWAALGPRMGLSNVARVKLCIELNILTWSHVKAGVRPDAKSYPQ